MARRFTLNRNRDGNYHIQLQNTRGVVPVLTLTSAELADLVAAARELLARELFAGSPPAK